MTAEPIAFTIFFVKQCPECSAEFDDSVSFCPEDGKSLVTKASARARLCPHCANSIAETAARCPYCKADLAPSSDEQWPARESEFGGRDSTIRKSRLPKSAKAVLVAGLVLFVVGMFLVGRSLVDRSDRGEFASLVEEKIKELQEKEQRIETLESEIARLQKRLEDASAEAAQMEAKLDESHKELTSTRQRLGTAQREADRSASMPQPPPTRKIVSAPEPPVPTARRRAAEPGLYETIRPTPVHEEPVESSRVLSRINKGTRVTVVRSVGAWLEVRSKHGNPPGFILWDDAMFLGAAD